VPSVGFGGSGGASGGVGGASFGGVASGGSAPHVLIGPACAKRGGANETSAASAVSAATSLRTTDAA
jgi:hypothetical protein